MMSSSLGLATALLLASQAQSYFVPTPKNGYLGDGTGNITCSAAGANITLAGEFAATGPLIVEENQPFYANDVAGNLTIPQALGALADTLLVDHINVHVFLDLHLINLTPELLIPLPNGIWINNTKLNATGDTHLQFPADGGVLGGFGPIYGGPAGTSGDVYLGDVFVQLYFYTVDNIQVLGPVNVTCPEPEYNALLATFQNVPATSDNPPLLDIKNGFNADYPPLAPQQQFGCLDFEYECAVGSKGTYTFEVATCVGAGFLYETNGTYNFFNSTGRLTIPEALVAGLKGFYPTATSIQAVISSLYVELSNASPSTLNPIPASGYVSTNALPASGDLTFYVPDLSNPGFNSPSFVVANAPGSTVDIVIGNSSSYAVYLDSTGQALGADNIFCTTKVPHLEGIGITIYPPSAPAYAVGI